MKRVRRILPIFLALVMCVTSILPVYATGDVTTTSTETIGSFSTTNGTVMFEAEDASINTENDPNATDYAAKNDVVRVEEITGTTTATTASGEEAVRMRIACEKSNTTGIAYADYTPNLDFDVTVDQAGTYYVWARVAVHSKSYRTIWLAIDQAENYTNTTPSKQYYDSETPSFVWEKIATIENREEGESIRVDIKPRHGNSAMGILIDTFVVTADAAFKPTDTALLSVASINETEYASLETAIDAAPASSVIKLLKNVEAESIETEKYFTLDLNGYTLQVSSFGKYVNVVDNSTTKTGLLEVAADKCTLPPTNEQMPVYDSTKNGYVFATITDQNDGGTISEDSFKLIFRPSFGEGDTVKNTLLKNGGEAAGISIRIRLDWKVNNEAKSKFLTYGKYAEGAEYVDMIAEVYSLDKAFYINATGTNSFAGLKVTPYIESTTGVVKELTTFTINQ